MSKSLFIYGAGGLGKEILALLMALPEWSPAGFFDDGLEKGTIVSGMRVLGGMKELKNRKDPVNLIIGIGDPDLKSNLVQQLLSSTHTFPVLIHPSAILLNTESISIASGSVVAAGCLLTTDIRIGHHTLLNLNVTVGHDSFIGDCTSIMPGANLAGKVTIGNRVLVGSGVNVINNIRIGDSSKIGAGAVVIHDVPENVTAVGVPSRVIKR